MKKENDEEALRKHLKRHQLRKEVKFTLLVVLLMAVAFIAAFFFGGTGGGSPERSGNPESGGGTRSVAESAVPTASADSAGEGTASLPANITLHIEETRVSVGDRVFEDAAALRAFLESIHNDSRTYRLEEKDAILATHEWVVAVFEELRIPLTQ